MVSQNVKKLSKIYSHSITLIKLNFLFIALLSFKFALASDTTGIPDLDTQATAAEQMIEFVAKWGGIAMIVVVVLAIGFGKAKGEIAYALCAVGIAIGGLSAAWGWFGTSFAHGFVF
ncbi:MAG: hypothetical protein QG673_1887 [Pseudomonadota bacterium]|nr:hypothetical protein [Pseudomonadota bacterium]